MHPSRVRSPLPPPSELILKTRYQAEARLKSSPKISRQALLIYLYLFTAGIFFSVPTTSQASNCSSQSFDERAVVTHVYDGDTVKLANGDNIRLIGINTPEMNFDTGTPEPYAVKAKRFLEKRVLKNKVGIKYGSEKKDKYKRKLAHIFLLDGTNIQHEILKSGLAFSISIPPNLWQHNCYQNAEKYAQKKQSGVWKSPYFKPVNAKNINKNHLGFKIITGKIDSVKHTEKSIWLKFSEKMALRVDKKDLHYFKNTKLGDLKGKQITARGWISLYKNKFSIRLKHPDAMSVK